MRNTWVHPGVLRGVLMFAALAMPGSGLHAETPEAKRPEDAKTLAWIRFEDAAESYQGTPYRWLGNGNIVLSVDVRPQAGHVLHLLWGSKNDARQALASINGKPVNLRSSGYDGFRWLSVPLSTIPPGDRYEIVLSPTVEKAAFLAGICLTSATETGVELDLKKPAYKMAVSFGPATLPLAFPEMQAVWDREPPAPIHPLPDAGMEAAFRQAEKHARQANEQFFRCRRFVDGWLAEADPQTGLIPRNLTESRDVWNAQDSAADNYPYMVLTAALTDRQLFEGRMLDMLRTETRLTSRLGRLPDTWSFSKQVFAAAQPNLDSIIFGSSEYVKDGLIPLTEWLGPSPWSERMLGIVDDVCKYGRTETPYGLIPSTNIEVNGDMLQSLSRVYWMTGEKKYLEYACRLGDYYLLGNHHPTRDLDSLRLRDHGCEVTDGLAELYVAVSFADPAKKKAYQGPIHAMFDRILEVGRDEHGMLYNTIHGKTGEHDKGICDTWGYNYDGIYTVYLIDGTEAYRQAVRHALGSLKEHLTTYHWGSADEYADSIEGAINLYNREPVESAADWIDTEIHDMWRVQRPDGIVEGWHGDGNSARTAIMYALWKTQGLTIHPWRADVRFGTVRRGDTLYICLTADKPWSGKLLFDRQRHKLQMHLPLDYTRINQFPEWFTADDGRTYTVGNLSDGRETAFGSAELQQGIAVELKPGIEQRWIVKPVQ